MGIILSTFQGCGREYLKNTYGDKVKIFDAVEELDKNDLEGYVNKVMDIVDDNDIVFIDASENVRNAFNEKKIDYDLFYPSKERRNEFIGNCVIKHIKPNLIRDFDNSFIKSIESIDNDESGNCYKHKLENKGEFLGNSLVIMQYISSIGK